MSYRILFPALLLACIPAAAQVSTATIHGTVRDSGGGLIPEAAILLRNPETGIERRTVSNDAGSYVLLNIQPGTYTLEAGKSGLTTSRLAPFTLVVNQTATFDFTLNVGSVQQAVTVEAIGAEVQSSTAEFGRRHHAPARGRSAAQRPQLHATADADARGFRR